MFCILIELGKHNLKHLKEIVTHCLDKINNINLYDLMPLLDDFFFLNFAFGWFSFNHQSLYCSRIYLWIIGSMLFVCLESFFN